MIFERLGESALMIKAEQELILQWAKIINQVKIAGVEECLPCYCSLTIFYHQRDYKELVREIRSVLVSKIVKGDTDPRIHKIPVCYEGEYALDMEDVGRKSGLSVNEVVERHVEAEYSVAGLGFSPGFGFLKGLDEGLHLPRRTEPRVKVPKGSVGIAGEQTGIYPSSTSGGWNLIGRTPISLVDYNKVVPSLFGVGDKVKFYPISGREFEKLKERHVPFSSVEPIINGVEILRVGGMTTIQDLGRTNYRNQGFPAGGAMDREIVTQINTLLKNKDNAPVVEFFQVGMKLRFSKETSIVVGGNVLPKLNALIRSPWMVLRVKEGDELDIGALANGSWGYLAIKGGFNVDSFLGSVSTHPHLDLGGMAGRVLKEGDHLSYHSYLVENDGQGRSYQRNFRSREIRCLPGAQYDWFSEDQRDIFLNTTYQISDLINRVGYRLKGRSIEKKDKARELMSEGVCPGTIQITNGGLPLVLLADTQSVGGYPKIAYIRKDNLSAFTQCEPGDKIRFRFD